MPFKNNLPSCSSNQQLLAMPSR